ncbi:MULTISPECIES: DUF2076 domain-containing protein [Pseudomonas]|uniref:ABC transporter substrate-binding protein n=1 Tax=Pseudomonas lutea TaxID=243924 RepID=A0A9X8MFD5_9PSED|nr:MULTISPECIES: DUF2076 domain-containing protein [Pseudomonas]SER05686.1 hypothetical protein SAMN05216409_111179 [Pseudomonas lutea]
MQSEEKQLIEGLFTRLKDAEAQTASRDVQAEAYIQERLQQQPAAPYYMAQVILIQEAALKRLDQRVRDLEAQITQMQQNKPSSSGFLSNLFGGGSQQEQSRSQSQAQAQAPRGGWTDPGPRQAPSYGQAPGYGQPNPGYGYNAAPAAPSRAGSFLGGAMQTAVGVAGGVLLAETISSMFHDSQPQEIVNIINEEPAADLASDTGGQDSGLTPASDAGGYDDGYGDGGFQQADYGSDDSGFFDDGGDDDQFI